MSDVPVRLTFDARGETDLRPARTSHFALVKDRADYDYNPGGQMQPDSSDLVLYLTPGTQSTLLWVDTPGHFQVIHNHQSSAVSGHLVERSMSVWGKDATLQELGRCKHDMQGC